MALGAVSTPSKTWVPPVGMIITTGSPTSPAEIYDGTSWARITDRFPIGAGESYSLGSTGGSATHTLTVAEMPAHSHGATVLSAGEHSHTVTSYYDTGSVSMMSDYDCTGDNDDYRPVYPTNTTSSNGAHGHTATIGSAGNGQAFSIMNPYVAKYIWYRVS